jgi:hypothetical protein
MLQLQWNVFYSFSRDGVIAHPSQIIRYISIADKPAYATRPSLR